MEAYNLRNRNAVMKNHVLAYIDDSGSSDDERLKRIDPDYVKYKRQMRSQRSKSGEGSSATAQSNVTNVTTGNRGNNINSNTPMIVVEPEEQEQRNVLSWMISRRVLEKDERVWYFDHKRGNVILEGAVRPDGIFCTCCSDVVTVYTFEHHAKWLVCETICNRSPYANIFVPAAKCSMLCSMIQAWNHNEEIAKHEAHEFRPLANANDENDDACIICADGGNLICCEKCPSTFHFDCMGMTNVPQEDWMCPYCICKYCGIGEGELYKCVHCEKKYHPECSKVCNGMKLHFTEKYSYCRKECKEVYGGLHAILGVKNDLGDGLSWSLLQKRDVPPTRLVLDEGSNRIEMNAKIAVASAILNDIFQTTIDRHTKINVLESVVYCRESNLNRLNFGGFYVAVLEKNDQIVTVATIRVHGTELAEMPYIGTIEGFRNKGMSRILVNCIESILYALKVRKLVLPSLPDLVNMWTVSYHFIPIDPFLKMQLRKLNVMAFPKTYILQKQIYPKKGSLGSIGQGMTIDDLNQAEEME